MASKKTAVACGKINHFPLRAMLPDGHMLALDTSLGVLSQIACDEGVPRMVAGQIFTASEVCVLLPILEAYPYYCPCEVLLASFNSSDVTEQMITHCRQRLRDVQGDAWEREMQPLRNLISRVRLKLDAFDMSIASILETGYMLAHKSERHQSVKQKTPAHRSGRPGR